MSEFRILPVTYIYQTYEYIYIYTHIHIYINIYTHIHHTYIHISHTQIHIYIYTTQNTQEKFITRSRGTDKKKVRIEEQIWWIEYQ